MNVFFFAVHSSFSVSVQTNAVQVLNRAQQKLML